MKKRISSIGALAAALILPLQVNAALLYGGDNSSQLWAIDTDADTVTLVGSTTNYGPETQLTPDGSTVLLTDTSSTVYRLDSVTAADLGSTTISFPPGTWNTVTAMEYVGATLYASFDQAGPETGPGLLGTLDPVTGATTEIGTLSGVVAPTGGMAYDGGTMYAVSSADSVGSELYTINLATGTATKIADITLGGAEVQAITALVIADGVAYTKSNATIGGTNDEALYSLDLATGALTEVFDMGEFIVSLTAAPVVTTAAPGPGVPIPTLSIWSLGVLASMLGVIGLYHRRRS